MDLPFSTETGEFMVYEDRREIPYEILGPLGGGAYGTVYRVKRISGRRSGTVYALKSITLRQGYTSRGNALERCQNEVKMIKQARHIHVITLVETYKCRREFCIIMEPVAEGTLQDYLKYADQCDGTVFANYREQLFKWFGCLASALAFVHYRGIRHRDIKPTNILVQGNNLLLTDFGISFVDTENTEQGETDVFGTAKYRAPEPVRGIRFGRHADVFALGAVFLEMITVCCGQDNLSEFKAVCSGPYSENLSVVHSWIEQIQWRSKNSVPTETRMVELAQSTAWTLSMLFLIRNMLEPERRFSPPASAIAMCWAYCPLTGVPSNECNCTPEASLPADSDMRQRTVFVFEDSLRDQNYWAYALAVKHVSHGDVLRWKCCRCGEDRGQASFTVDWNFAVRDALSCGGEGCGWFICERCPKSCFGLPPPPVPHPPALPFGFPQRPLPHAPHSPSIGTYPAPSIAPVHGPPVFYRYPSSPLYPHTSTSAYNPNPPSSSYQSISSSSYQYPPPASYQYPPPASYQYPPSSSSATVTATSVRTTRRASPPPPPPPPPPPFSPALPAGALPHRPPARKPNYGASSRLSSPTSTQSSSYAPTPSYSSTARRSPAQSNPRAFSRPTLEIEPTLAELSNTPISSSATASGAQPPPPPSRRPLPAPSPKPDWLRRLPSQKE